MAHSLSTWRRRLALALLLPAILLAAPRLALCQKVPSDEIAVPSDEIAVLWADDDGKLACAWTPPEPDAWLPNFTFQDGSRWSSTATDGGGLQRGDPTTVRWSIVPDGTSVFGFIGEGTSNSNLVAFLDGIHHGGPGPGGADLTQRAWWALFDAVFDRWSELTGLTYVYEPADDGAALTEVSTPSGVIGVRGDVRIMGHSIDGQSGSNVLAYNFFPNTGDMVIDTDNLSNFSSSSNSYLLFRNTLAHEHGHGIGLSHVCPVNSTKLMEPFLGLSFDGPQQDDILAANRGYGDPAEKPDQNDTALTATALGDLAGSGSASADRLSVDGTSDLDVFAFGADGGAALAATVTPIGTAYLSGPQNSQTGACSAGTTFDALRQSDLELELLDVDGSSVLAAIDAGGLGDPEELAAAVLPSAGTYFVRVVGDVDRVQRYELDLSLAPPSFANLSVTKTASDDPSPRGASLFYAITVTNQGPGSAAGVVVSESLPGGVTFVETAGCAEDPGGVPICSLGSLAVGESVSYSVRVTVDSHGSPQLNNSVAVSSANPDPQADNDTALAATTAVTFPCAGGAGATLELDAADNGSESVYLAEGTILAGDGFAVGGGEDVTFIAGAQVVLGSGFGVALGASFGARVDELLSCP
jgi:uncharacterized repeat protein (TIGR01451 family)